MYQEEEQLRKRGFKWIAGTDEAGRGPLAGPVVAAAVIMPRDYKNEGIKDSKKLSALGRERLFVEIKNTAISYGIGVVGWKQIDEMGILNASKLAMRRAILQLNPLPDFVLSDAVEIHLMGIAQKAIVKADEKVFSVAAASILAKVYRDKLMQKYHQKFPEYDFANHMGYGTKAHLEAIKKHGACQIHRLSFRPFSAMLTNQTF